MFVPLFPFPVPIPSSGNSSCPLIVPRCYVRPVQPTGLAAVFLLDKGKRLSVARSAAPPPEDAADPVPPPPIPLGHKAGGSKGARPPSPEVQEPGGSWRIFAYFLYARK